jgi:hypothetical protein
MVRNKLVSKAYVFEKLLLLYINKKNFLEQTIFFRTVPLFGCVRYLDSRISDLLLYLLFIPTEHVLRNMN